jgi:hypothetical protein
MNNICERFIVEELSNTGNFCVILTDYDFWTSGSNLSELDEYCVNQGIRKRNGTVIENLNKADTMLFILSWK